MGFEGPPGESLSGATHVARFDSPDDVINWLFGAAGTWQAADGRLVLESVEGERMTAGPSTRFSHDVDISVAIAGVVMTSATECGIRFHVGDDGAYQFGVNRDGMCRFVWEDAAQQTGVLLTQTIGSSLPSELRVVRRGNDIKLYVNGRLIGTVTDAALDDGYIQLFVQGTGSVAFDDVWVGTAVLLE